MGLKSIGQKIGKILKNFKLLYKTLTYKINWRKRCPPLYNFTTNH